MNSRFEAWLDGAPLSSIAEEIYIRDIRHTPASPQDTVSAYGGRDGGLLTRRYIGSAEVTIAFEIHAYGIERRQEICDLINAWALKGGYLTTNDKPDKRLNVVCSQPPAIESALKWTDEVSLKFTAYALPYWEDLKPKKLTLTGTSASGSLKVNGYADRAYVTANVKVTGSSNLTTLTLTAGNTTITLDSLNLAQNSVIRLVYDDRHILSLLAGNTRISPKRTPESDDDLRLETGQNNTVTISANTAVQADFEARGLYM